MNDLQELSGPWRGFWIQTELRYHMRLRLRFVGDTLSGDGSDGGGDSEIRGSMSAGGVVSFTKYYATHVVHYEGRWDGQLIAGIWTMKHPLLYGNARFIEVSGEFEIWPEVNESGLIADLLDELHEEALSA